MRHPAVNSLWGTPGFPIYVNKNTTVACADTRRRPSTGGLVCVLVRENLVRLYLEDLRECPNGRDTRRRHLVALQAADAVAVHPRALAKLLAAHQPPTS